MYISKHINDYIEQLVYKESQEKDANHVSSGKLSASMLGGAYQWMVLKTLGVKPSFDNYDLRKFLRGNDVEAWLVKKYKDGVSETQKFVEYNGCIGYLDILGKINPFRDELLPIEVKSVTNAKYARIKKQARPDRGHKLQAGFYGLALGLKQSSICYIASDDYRILHFVFDTSEVEQEINTIIATYNGYIERKEIPEFYAIESWMAGKWNAYPEWMLMDKKELAERAKKLYEQATSGR